ncbi:MAG: ammonia monooxygenase [Planctomycetes bacterium]|nr:ammonia monooxygenase [Planctomycetota bacterium]
METENHVVVLTRGEGLWFWCTGCAMCHRVPVIEGPRVPGKLWGFNGDRVKPTLTPSVHHPGQCHLTVRDGMLVYENDCTHELAGKTVPMRRSWDWW